MGELGHHLRQLRERSGMSLRYVAAKVRITPPYLSDIELGRRHPSERVLGDLARVLRAPIDELRQRDPRIVVEEIRKRIAADATYAPALHHLMKKCPTGEDLMRMLTGPRPSATRRAESYESRG
jgi:transcriptional regulator with XRE-family HTH domain